MNRKEWVVPQEITEVEYNLCHAKKENGGHFTLVRT